MQEIEKLNNKDFAFYCIELLIKNDELDKESIRILKDENECKKLFSSAKFAILHEISKSSEDNEQECYDEYGRQRFYKENINFGDRKFLISNHWYGPGKCLPDNRSPFQKWVMKKAYQKN